MKLALVRALRGAQVRFVRVITCSTSNVIRGKAASIDNLEDVFTHGIGLTAALPAFPVMYDVVVPGSGLGPAGEVRLRNPRGSSGQGRPPSDRSPTT